MTILAIVLFIISIMVPGYLISLHLPATIRQSIMERLLWSGLFGSSLVSLYWFVLRLIGLNSLLYMILGWLVLVSILFYFQPTWRPKNKFSWPRFNFWELSALAGIVTILLLSLIRALRQLVLSYDSLYVWSFRAKLWYFETGPQTELMSQGSWHLNYPWQISLMQYWLGRLHGSWSDSLVNFVPWFYYLLSVVLVFVLLRRVLSRLSSQFWTLFYMSLPLVMSHSYQAYADLALATYVLAGLALLINYWRTADRLWLIWSAVTFGLGFFVKLDALLFVVSGCLVLLVASQGLSIRNIYRSVGVFLIVALSALSPWALYLWFNDLGLSNVTPGLVYLPRSLWSFLENWLWLANWHILWFVVFTFFLIYIKLIVVNKPLLYGWLFFWFSLLILAVIYIFTQAGVFAINQTATGRNLLLLAPSAVYLLGLTWNEAKLFYDQN